MSRLFVSLSVRSFIASAALSSLPFCAAAQAGDFGATVVQYTPGALGPDGAFNDPQAAIGPMTDNTQFGSLNPFNPPFNAPPGAPNGHGQIVIIGPGGSLTLKLQTPVKTAGGYLGVFVNNGLIDISADGSGQANGGADTFSDSPQSLVSVSDSLLNPFVSVRSGAALFDNPSNYWSNAPAYTFYDPLPGTIAANESQPFLGTVGDFSNRTMPQILALLNGSAGGTWLPLSGVAPTEIQYVTFTVPVGASYRMVVDAVSATPEPGMGIAAAGGVGLFLARRRPRVS